MKFLILLCFVSVCLAEPFSNWAKPTKIANGVSPSLRETENSSYIVFCEPQDQTKINRLMFSYWISGTTWSTPKEIGGGCDCIETSIVSNDNHFVVVTSGRHQYNAKCSSSEISGIPDIYVIESFDSGKTWKPPFWLSHNNDNIPRTTPRMEATSAAIWVTSFLGYPNHTGNIVYWINNNDDGWNSEKIVLDDGNDIAYTISATMQTSSSSVLFIASLSADMINKVVCIGCETSIQYRGNADVPIHPIIVSIGQDFLALLTMNLQSQLTAKVYSGSSWHEKGVLIEDPMSVYPAVAIQQDSTLAVVAPNSSICPSSLNSWEFDTSLSKGVATGSPTLGVYCVFSHPRVEFKGKTNLISVVFVDSNFVIYYNSFVFTNRDYNKKTF